MSEKSPNDEPQLDNEFPNIKQTYGEPLKTQMGDAAAESGERDQWQAKQISLVARCLEGDEQAFALIIDHYGNLLLRTAYLLVQDEEAAKDIVQDSLLLAWKHIATLREPAFLRAWLLKIVVNQSTSLKRQWGRKAALLREQFAQRAIEETFRQSDFIGGYVEDRLDVACAIEQLPINQRTVLIFFYYHHMTIPEIATMLNVSENTLRKRLQAALDKLRRVLQIELDATRNIALGRKDIEANIRLHKGGV